MDVPLRYRRLPGAERRKRINESLERVGLSARAKHYPAELSGGQQQRVAIARALAGGPRLLLADEPTGNLDSQMARSVMQLLEELHRDGATIVMVTHDPELAARAQREVRIVDGQVIDLAAQTRLVGKLDAAADGVARPRFAGEEKHPMMGYYLQLGLRTLRRNIVLTSLIIAAGRRRDRRLHDGADGVAGDVRGSDTSEVRAAVCAAG